MSKDPRQNPFRPNRPFGSQPSPPLMQQQPHPHRLQQHHNPINPAPFFHPQQNSPRLRLPLHQNQGGISRSSLDSGHDSLPQTPQQEPSCTVFPPQSPLMYPFPSPNSMTSPCGSASGAFNPLGSLTQAQELTALRKELDAKNDTIKSLEKSHSGFSKQIANLMAFKKEEKERNEQLKQESKEKDVEIQRLNGEASRLNDALLAGREREKNLEQRVESQKKNLERNQKMRDSQTAEQEKKEAKMGQMRKENSKLKTEVEQIGRKMEQMKTEKEQMKKEMEKTREEKNNLKAEKEQMKREMEKTREEKNNLKAEKEQMKREMEKTREEKNNLKAEKEQTKREMGKIRSELNEKQEQIEELNRQNSSNEQQMELHKMELGQLEQKHKQNLKRQKTELDLKKAQELQELEVQKDVELQKIRAELLVMQRKGGVERCPRCESNDMREVLDVYKETMKECYRRHKCGVCGPIVREDPSGGSAASTIRAHSPPPRPATNVSRHKRNADNTPNEVAKKQCRNSDPQSMTSTPSHSSFPSTSNFNNVSGFVNALHNQQNVQKEDGRMSKKELMLRTGGVGGGGRANCAENNREEEEDDDEIQVLEEERPPTSNSIVRTPSTANSEVLPTLFANNQSSPQTDEKYNGENILREIETGIQADNTQMTIIMQEKREETTVLTGQKRSDQKVEVDAVEGSRTQCQAVHSRILVPPPPQPTLQLSGTPSQQTSSNSAVSASASSQQQQQTVLQKRLDRIQQEASEQPQQRDVPQHGASANTLSHPQVEHRRNNIMSQQQQQQQQMQQQNWQGQLQQQQQRGQPNQHQMSQQLQSQPLARLPQQTPMDPNAFNLSSSQPRPQQQPMFGVTLTSQESWFPMQQPQSQQYQQQQQQVAPVVHPVTAAFQQQLMMSQFIPNVQYPTPPFQQTSQQQQYLQPQQSAIGGQDPIGQLRQMFLHLPPRQQ